MRTLMLCGLLLAGTAQADTVDELLDRYRAAGASEFSAERGASDWQREVSPAKGGDPRSCVSCHGSDLTAAGKHVRTGKVIKPLAPSANPKRLSDPKKIEKWFKRNCKWTWGRECTPVEKGNFLQFLRNQ